MKMDSVKLNGNYESKGIEDRFSAAVNVIRSLPKNGKHYFILYAFIRNMENLICSGNANIRHTNYRNIEYMSEKPNNLG